MQDRIYLDDCIYHMVHIDTLDSILRTGLFLSKEQARFIL